MSDDGNGMIVYSMPPIDWWPGWVDEQLLWSDRRFWRDLFYDQNEFDCDSYLEWLNDYIKHTEQAFQLALHVGWEGDIRGGDFGLLISGSLPVAGNPDCHPIKFSWKQSNNGLTFVGCPESEIALTRSKYCEAAYFVMEDKYSVWVKDDFGTHKESIRLIPPEVRVLIDTRRNYYHLVKKELARGVWVDG